MRPKSKVAFAFGLTLCLVLFAAALRFGGSFPSPSRPGGADRNGTENRAFPRVARDIHGDELRLVSAPRAIASQSLVTDHFLLALVSPERVVAVSPAAHDRRYSHVADILRDMDVAVATDPEAVLRRSPDLILVSQDARAEYVDIARTLGTPVFRMRTIFENFEQIASGLETTGFLLGEDVAADREIRRLRERVAAAAKLRPPDAEPIRVLAFSNFGNTYGKGSLFDHILAQLGAINVAAERGIGPYGSISSEHVAAWNPDWIVAGGEPESATDLRARFLADTGVAASTAGRKGQVLIVENRRYLSMSQHVAGLLEDIATAIYPDSI